MSRSLALSQKSNPLLPHLPDSEVLTSCELIARLRASGMKEENARQFLRRNALGPVWRSEWLRLPKDERLFAHRTFLRTPQFFEAVGKKLLETNRGGLARCLHAL